MRVYPKATVLTTKPHSNVRECIASLRGLVVRTVTLGKTRIRANDFYAPKTKEFAITKKMAACRFFPEYIANFNGKLLNKDDTRSQ